MKNQEIILVIHNVRSVYNVGSMFRTAETAGVSKIYLTGYTPQPIDRFGRPRKDISKTALGAEKTIPWEHYTQIGQLINILKKDIFFIIAIEQSPKAIDYKEVKPKQKTALIVGNEVRGLSKAILDKCDVVAQIPMRGKKESLNVSVALGVALFRMFNI